MAARRQSIVGVSTCWKGAATPESADAKPRLNDAGSQRAESSWFVGSEGGRLKEWMKNSVWRTTIEIGFIVFLFYSNLLMGEFERSSKGMQMGLAWAVRDIFTKSNFLIALVAALIGYVVFEFLRTNFQSK